MYCTTLNRIRACSPCEPGWKKLLNNLGKTQADDELLPMATILASNGLDDTLWCLRSCPEFDRLHRHFAVWCARQVQHLMTDKRSIAALDVAERHADGLVTDDALAAARAAAWAAARAAAREAAREAAWAAAMAAWAAAREAAREAAWAAASEAARAAAWAAAMAARAAAREAAWAKQESMLRRVLTAPSMDEAIDILRGRHETK